MTDTCKNITLPETSFLGCKNTSVSSHKGSLAAQVSFFGSHYNFLNVKDNFSCEKVAEMMKGKVLSNNTFFFKKKV